MLVVCDTPDLAYREMVEKNFERELSRDAQVQVIKDLDLFPPTREFTADDRKRMVIEAKVAYVLRIALQGSEELKKLVTTYWTDSAVTRERRDKAIREFGVSFESIAGGPKLWVGAGSYEDTDPGEILDEFSDDVVDDLVRKGILPRRNRKGR